MEINKLNSIVLCSGGMDSTVLMYLLISKGIDFIPVFIDYGQHCKNTEYNRLMEVIPTAYKEKVKTLEISSVYTDSSSALIKEVDLWSTDMSNNQLYLPYRNLLFLTAGAAYAQSRKLKYIYAGFINSNHAVEIDCSTSFFDNLSELLTEYGSVEIVLPFKNYSKYEVALLAIKHNVPLARTFSCQVSSIIPCGACPNCVERIEALKKIEN